MRSLALALFLVPALAFGQAIPPESGGGGSGVAEDLLTAEMDTTKHLVPDGAGGAEWLVPAAAAPAGHNTSHENGGADEIDVTGLVGLPAAYDGGAVTNPFLAPDGAVGAPSYSFSTDLDTGLWIDTDGGSNEELNFSVQGDRLFNLEQNAGGTTQRMAFNNAANETVFLCQGNATTKTCQVALFGIGGSAFYVEANATDTQITLGSSSGLRDARVTLWGTTAVIRWDPAITGTQYGEFVPLSAYTGARQYHLPDATGDMALLPASGASTFALATTLVTNEVDVANSVWGASNGLVFEGATGGADTFETTLTLVDPTGDNTITLQNATGTVALTSDLYDGGAFSPSADDTSSNGSVASKWQNVYVTRSIQGSKSKALTDATATAFVRVAIPQTIATNYKGGEIIYEIYCDDDTNQASQSGTVKFTCHNLAGTEACGFSTPDGVTLGDGTANLVAPVFTAATAAADTIDLQVDSNCTGIVPNTHTIEYRLDMPTTATLTPQ